MKMALLAVAVLMPTITLPVLAQDHSQHRSAPPTTERPNTPSSAPNAEDHSQHSTSPPLNKDADESTQSELRHIPPDPPAHAMPEMTEERMMELMEMDDTSKVSMVLLDHLEGYRTHSDAAIAWDAQAWYGNDYDKLRAKTEGKRVTGEAEGSAELLWDRIVARWWNMQAGIRHDFGEGTPRTWAAIGVAGLAPYWFDIEATLYVGEEGRTAARVKAEYELLFTQRLILRPELEMNLYDKEDRQRNIGAGLANVAIGLRLRYEFRRELAPYLGASLVRSFGDTSDLVRAAGKDRSDVQFVAGLRLWF